MLDVVVPLIPVALLIMVAVLVSRRRRRRRRRRPQTERPRARGIIGHMADGPDKGTLVVISLDGPASAMRLVGRDDKPLTIAALAGGMALGGDELVLASQTQVSGEAKFIHHVIQTAAGPGIPHALDLIFEHVDDQFRRGDFGTCEELLDLVPVSMMQHELLVGFLSATWPARRKLPSRSLLLERVERRLRADKIDDVDGLLLGLR